MRMRLAAAMVLALAASAAGEQASSQTRVPDSSVRLGLEECIRLAVANSDTLEAERQRLAVLDAKVDQSFWAIFSNFDLEVNGTAVPDKCVDEEWLERSGAARACGGGTSSDYDYDTSEWGPRIGVEIEGGVPLFTFGKIAYGRRALKEARAAKQAEFPRFEQQIRYQVTQAYNAILGAREMLYTIDQGRKHLTKAREKVEADLAAQTGTATEIDLIKLKVFESTVDQYEAQSREIERTGLAALRFLVGGPHKDVLDTTEAPQERDPRDLTALEEYRRAALERRPELKALRHAVSALEAKVKMSRSELWPDLLLVAGFRYGWTPGRTNLDNWSLQDSYNYGPGFGVGLVLEYKLDFGLDYYELTEAKAELAAAVSDQQAALSGVMLEVEETYNHAVSTRDALAAMERSRKLVKGWIGAAVQNHATGIASAKEVSDALKEYFAVMASIHKLTNDYNVSLADLERVTGAPLEAK